MFFEDNPEHTKFGYFVVDNVKTFSKFEAFQMAGKDWSKVRFVFNDNVYDNYDFTKEPDIDIYELYRQRAQQLREKYDYLVLMFSGGVDSQTILETFINNNIYLNEVCTVCTSDVEDKSSGPQNKEVFNYAKPYLDTLGLDKVHTKVRYAEIGKLIVDQWNDTFEVENFQHYLGGGQWRACFGHKFKESIKEHMDLNNKGFKVCYIWGFDKPSIEVEDGKHCLQFADVAIEVFIRNYINRGLLKNKFYNFFDEAFYITPDLPEISIKQAHLLLKAIKEIPNSDSSLLTHPLPPAHPYVAHHRYQDGTDDPKLLNKFLDKQTVDKAIYPKAILSQFIEGKKVWGSMILSTKDLWFSQSNHPNRLVYEHRLRNLVKENPYFFLYSKDNSYKYFESFFTKAEYKDYFPLRPRPVVSKKYVLEK